LWAGSACLAREAISPDAELLWPQGTPDAVADEAADQPALRFYPAANPNGACVLVCPGGRYHVLASNHEGQQVAKWFNSFGVSAAVLRYRLAPRYRHPAQLNDVQRALRTLRATAEQRGFDVQRLGVMGFSAGGHLAAMASTHYDLGEPQSSDPIERESCRPAFTILGYPVVSLKREVTHGGSRDGLLSPQGDEAAALELSSETKVTDDTPPAFLFHTVDDTAVPVENSVRYCRALAEHHVPVEMHLYQSGPHGVGLAAHNPALQSWTNCLQEWMRGNGWLTSRHRSALQAEVSVAGEPLAFGVLRIESQDDAQAPVYWGVVHNGTVSADAAHGPVVGRGRVSVYDFGRVSPDPTLDDLDELTAGKGIEVEIGSETNVLNFDL
ncbi:MAG: alpha/beta hydrolase, partial [Planctomycetales bacterium]|nr:alpha/beta hydrolase [Planctomycetales bacterium]